VPDSKAEVYEKIMHLFESCRGDVMVLARYMQILSPGCASAMDALSIFITHSCRPSVLSPITRRMSGVKLIGEPVICHYRTDAMVSKM